MCRHIAKCFYEIVDWRIKRTTSSKYNSWNRLLRLVQNIRLHCSRSSRSQMFLKIGVLKTFASFTGKHLRWSHRRKGVTFLWGGGELKLPPKNCFIKICLWLGRRLIFCHLLLPTPYILKDTVKAYFTNVMRCYYDFE